MARFVGAALAGLILVGAAAPIASAGSAVVGAPEARSVEATATRLEGVDVSHWQGTIDWTRVAAAGKSFAIIKATESTTYTDPLYATNHAAAKAAGLWTGAYHFARPSSVAGDAAQEAARFASVMNLGAGDLIPALDLEDSGGLGVSALQAWVKTFLDEVTARVGVRSMIYTSPAFWRKYMGDSHALADAGYKTLWVAHWGVTTPDVPASNWGGHGWTFWQYTSDGTVPGIAGRVDLDRFNGSDLMPQAFSAFKIAASIPSGSVKQGASSGASVSILRTNFSDEVALDVSGLPDGTTATFGTNPTTATAAAFTVTAAADPPVPVGTYPLTITGQSNGITRTTRLNLVVADGIAPTVSAPVTLLYPGRTLGTTTVPVKVKWTAADPSGIGGSGLQRSLNGGAWTTTGLSGAAALFADTSIPTGGTGVYRARATDTKLNTSAWLVGARVKTAVYQQTSGAVAWSGSWHTSASTAASGGSTRYATAAGASATFSFTGSSAAWVATKGPTRGSARIYVDGIYIATVSLYSTTSQARVVAFARNFPRVGTHTLKVVVVGTASHPRVDVDAFIRLVVG